MRRDRVSKPPSDACKVWICPDCGAVDRHESDWPASYVPECESCADDPEGKPPIGMVLFLAVRADTLG